MSLWQLTKEVKESFLEGDRLELRPEGSVEEVILAKGGRNSVPDMRNSICKDPVVRSPENRKGCGFSGENEGEYGVEWGESRSQRSLWEHQGISSFSCEKYKANDCF